MVTGMARLARSALARVQEPGHVMAAAPRDAGTRSQARLVDPGASYGSRALPAPARLIEAFPG